MKKSKQLLIPLLAALCMPFSVGFVAAGESQAINIIVKEWQIRLSKKSVPAGPVSFNVRNTGGKDHELVIIKTDKAHNKLPLTRQGKVIEEGAGELIGEIEAFEPSQTQTTTFDLQPGRYVLICNMLTEKGHGTELDAVSEGMEVDSHYRRGMRVAFVVK